MTKIRLGNFRISNRIKERDKLNMSQIILIKNSFFEQAKIESYLRQELTLDLIVKDSIKDALMVLRILPDVQGIILPEMDRTNKRAIAELKDYCKTNTISTSILMTKTSSENPVEIVEYDFLDHKVRTVYYQLQFEDMKHELKLFIASKELPEERGYFSIPFSLILNTMTYEKILVFPFDLSFGIKKEDEDWQYVLRFRKNEPIDLLDLKKYQTQKNAERFFINVEQRVDFDKFFSDLRKKVNKAGATTFGQKIYSAELTAQILRNHFASFGMDDEGKELIEDYFQQSMMALKDAGAFSMLLKHFFENTSSYQYVHSMILALVLNKVTHRLGWDSQNFKEKVAFICLVHDLCLVDDELAFIESEAELNAANFSDAQKEMAMNHALKISTLIMDFKDRAIGVEEVLREHHGMRNGIGYARDLNYHLHHLSMAFITTQSFVHELLKLENPSKEKIKQVVQELGLIYNKGFYLKAYEALKAIFST